MQHPQIILASSSVYRKQLLERLGLIFTCISPDIDEQILADEFPADLVMRLAREKSLAVHERNSDAIIIGSDQVAVNDNTILNKPGNHELATRQLQQLSGKSVDFLTGICVIHSDNIQLDYVTYSVKFRKLDKACIENYLLQDKPYDCAGSFKSEGLGISLLESMSGSDPSALIGLPLIRLCEMLRSCGVCLP